MTAAPVLLTIAIPSSDVITHPFPVTTITPAPLTPVMRSPAVTPLPSIAMMEAHAPLTVATRSPDARTSSPDVMTTIFAPQKDATTPQAVSITLYYVTTAASAPMMVAFPLPAARSLH